MKKEEQHAVIIGSGLSGLTSGYILAKNGWRVTILEKDNQLGGCLQTFVRNDQKFDTGMHYIGSMKPGQTLYNYFKYFSLLKDVPLSPLNESGFDIISFAGRRFPIASGNERFISQLAKEFPGHEAELRHFREGIRKEVDKLPLYSFNFSQQITRNSLYNVGIAANTFLEQTVSEPLLCNVLAGNIPLYAGTYNKTPLHTYALIQDFYNNSAFRIVGGSDCIATSLIRSIRRMGGTIVSNSPVKEIRCDDKKAETAVLCNGEEIQGDVFISSLHPMRSLELLNTPLIRPLYRKRIAEIPNTISNFTVYLRFKPGTVPYLNSNLYHFDSPSVWNCEHYTPSEWPKQYIYMHMCNAPHQQYAGGAVLIAYMQYADVAKWKDTISGNRGKEYLSFKQEKAKKLIDALEKEMPGTKQNIAQYCTSSPLTYRDYTGTEKGALYGIRHDSNDPLKSYITHRTKIPNLFFTGQNIYSHGILGVIICSFITCAELLGTETLIEQLNELKS